MFDFGKQLQGFEYRILKRTLCMSTAYMALANSRFSLSLSRVVVNYLLREKKGKCTMTSTDYISPNALRCIYCHKRREVLILLDFRKYKVDAIRRTFLLLLLFSLTFQILDSMYTKSRYFGRQSTVATSTVVALELHS